MPRLSLVAAVLAVVIVAGCSGTQGPAASASAPAVTSTPTAEPTPTPTPDPLEAALGSFAKRDLKARIKVAGTIEFGDFTVSSEGTIDIDGADEHESYVTDYFSAFKQTSEIISIGHDEWKRVDEGPWFDSDATDDTPIVDDLAELTALDRVGDETLDRKPAIHVVPASSVTLAQKSWGPSEERVSDWTIEMDLWLSPDGSLLRIETHETGVTEGKAFTQDSTYDFGTLPASARFSAPEDSWSVYTSEKHGLKIAQPAGASLIADGDNDSFSFADGAGLSLTSYEKDASLKLKDYADALIAKGGEGGLELLDTVNTKAGTTPCILVSFSRPADAAALVDAICLGSQVYEFWILVPASDVQGARGYIQSSLTTVSFD